MVALNHLTNEFVINEKETEKSEEKRKKQRSFCVCGIVNNILQLFEKK